MKRVYKYLFVFLGSLFIFPLVSNAQCSYERQAELSKIAANVKFSYTYDVQEDRPNFTINITNITNDIYIKEQETGNIINKESNVPNTDIGGKSVAYNIYSNDANCKDELLITKYVTLPEYNNFSNIKDCQDYPEFKYCKKWMNTNDLTQEHFEDEFDKYIDRQIIKNTNEQTKSNVFDEIISQNKMWIILSLFGIISMVLLIFIKRRV